MVGNFEGAGFSHLTYWWAIWSFYIMVGDLVILGHGGRAILDDLVVL